MRCFFCTCFCQQTRVYLTGIEQFCLLTPMNYTTNTRDNLFVHQNGTRRNPQYMTIKGICHILVNDVSNARFNHFLGICLWAKLTSKHISTCVSIFVFLLASKQVSKGSNISSSLDNSRSSAGQAFDPGRSIPCTSAHAHVCPSIEISAQDIQATVAGGPYSANGRHAGCPKLQIKPTTRVCFVCVDWLGNLILQTKQKRHVWS
jgi:hypothetical protein